MKDNKEEEIKKQIDDLIDKMDLDIIQMEQFSASFLVIGYAYYIIAGNSDIAEILTKQDQNISGDDFFIIGQRFVLLGYFLLYVVSTKRISQKMFERNSRSETLSISPFTVISQTYLLSTIINYYRLEAFIAIKQDNIIAEESIKNNEKNKKS